MDNETIERLKNDPLWKGLAEKLEKGIITIDKTEPIEMKSIEEDKTIEEEEEEIVEIYPIVNTLPLITRSIDKKTSTIQISDDFKQSIRRMRKKKESYEETIRRVIGL